MSGCGACSPVIYAVCVDTGGIPGSSRVRQAGQDMGQVRGRGG